MSWGLVRQQAIQSFMIIYLKLHKVCTRWVPHQLTDDQKRRCVQFCRQSLKRFEEGQSRRVFDIITGDESWFYHYDPKTKEQSKVWVSKADPRPTKVLQNKKLNATKLVDFFHSSIKRVIKRCFLLFSSPMRLNAVLAFICLRGLIQYFIRLLDA
jgi:hypothetical protein